MSALSRSRPTRAMTRSCCTSPSCSARCAGSSTAAPSTAASPAPEPCGAWTMSSPAWRDVEPAQAGGGVERPGGAPLSPGQRRGLPLDRVGRQRAAAQRDLRRGLRRLERAGRLHPAAPERGGVAPGPRHDRQSQTTTYRLSTQPTHPRLCLSFPGQPCACAGMTTREEDLEMLFTCRPPGTTIPGRFPGPAHARGKWFSVDIHCHVLCQPARDLVAAEKLPDARHRHDSPETAAATAEHQRRVLPQLLSLEQRLADMDTMGIDVQAVSPSPDQTYYGLPPDLAIAATRLVNDNIADIMGRHPDRFAGLGTVPFQAPELAVGMPAHDVGDVVVDEA